MTGQIVEVRVSVPDEDTAEAITASLLEAKLAACVQQVGPIRSSYVWQEQMQQGTEWLLVIKSTVEAFDRLVAAVQNDHPYEVPEIVAVPVTLVTATYRDWVIDAVPPA